MSFINLLLIYAPGAASGWAQSQPLVFDVASMKPSNQAPMDFFVITHVQKPVAN